MKIILCHLVLLVWGCASSLQYERAAINTPSQKVNLLTPKDFMPLKIGNSWKYHVSYPGQEGIQTITIIKEKDGAFIDSTENTFTIDSQGLRDQQRYLIKNPLTVGTKWYSVSGPSSVEHFSIIDIPERCMVKSKAFDECLIVEGEVKLFDQGNFKTLWTYAKNIGIVEIITYLETSEGKKLTQSVLSLESYAF